ncbi:hypothetical protein UM399_11860 [Sulfitobacter pontiacus]|uniref:hypothetical protein n=1 Tax=Sulfitobacter pontiacus TaxID=60137 RepID=UPI002AC8A3EF|nr:hypothetical protein [Sulfitobacter pontiacus]WPZ24858.1 hypothetical protein UM399_11860 [Sulfitobacter pontiacus]
MAIFTSAFTAIVGFVSTTFGISVAAATTLTQVGISLAVSALNKPRQPTIPPQEVQANISQAAAARRRSYGKVLLGGVRAFFEAKDGVLHIIIVHNEGAVSEILDFVIDGEKVVLDGSGITTDTGGAFSFDGLVRIQTRNGTQSDYADLLAAFPAMWTAAHRIEGSVTTYARLTGPSPSRISAIFPKGANTVIQMIVNGAEVFDPRTNVVGFDDNPALVARDFMSHPDGMRIPEIHFDDDAIGTFANICDVQGYKAAGTYSVNDEPRNVLEAIMKTCDGQPYLTPEGKIGLMGGQYSEPDVTIGQDDILEVNWETGVDAMTDFNVLKGIYTSPDHNFKSEEAPERRNEALLDIQAERTETLDVPWCPDGNQMQKLMQTFEMRERPRYRVNIVTNLVGIKARFPKGDGIHTIRIDHPRIGGVYEVLSHGYSAASGKCRIGLRSTYDAWSNVDLKPLSPPLSSLSQNVQVNPVPSGLALAQEIVAISGETSGVQIVAQVSDPNRNDLQLIVEFKRADLLAFFPWTRMSVAEGALRAVSGVVAEGEYHVRAYWFGQGAAEEDYPEGTITVISNPTVPATPTEFDGSVAGSTASLTWVNAPANYNATRIFRNTVDSYAGASFVDDVAGLAGQPSSFTESPAAGTYFYWAVTLNPSFVPSPETASVLITIV